MCKEKGPGGRSLGRDESCEDETSGDNRSVSRTDHKKDLKDWALEHHTVEENTLEETELVKDAKEQQSAQEAERGTEQDNGTGPKKNGLSLAPTQLKRLLTSQDFGIGFVAGALAARPTAWVAEWVYNIIRWQGFWVLVQRRPAVTGHLHMMRSWFGFEQYMEGNSRRRGELCNQENKGCQLLTAYYSRR